MLYCGDNLFMDMIEKAKHIINLNSIRSMELISIGAGKGNFNLSISDIILELAASAKNSERIRFFVENLFSKITLNKNEKLYILGTEIKKRFMIDEDAKRIWNEQLSKIKNFNTNIFWSGKPYRR